MKPLAGIRILEFSTMVTASFAAMMLAEQGAEVIKVEPLEGGDPMRHLGSTKGGISALFAGSNRGKRSLRLDLKTDAAREIVEDLIDDADVVLTNFRPGVMDGLGLGSETLRRRNPRLVYGAVSGFGTDGPQRDAPAYDPIIQAQAGFAAVQGHGKRAPEFIRTLMCDKVTAYTLAQAVTTALFVRERTGEGQHIDLAMMDAGLYFLFPDGFMHTALGDDDADHKPPLSEMIYDMTETADGAITASVATPAQQAGLLTAVDRLDLLSDERFNSMEKLLQNVDVFKAEINATIATLETETLLEQLHQNDVPASRVLTHDEVFHHHQFAANDSVDVDEHPRMGSLRRVKPPAKFSGVRSQPASHAPAHGEHTEEILAALGRTQEQIEALIADDVTRPAV